MISATAISHSQTRTQGTRRMGIHRQQVASGLGGDVHEVDGFAPLLALT
jgi:hypothetical protein